jgi:hypothetical protein
VCFGDFSPGDPTPKSYGDIAIDKAVGAVLAFANRFGPANRQYQTMEQVASDHTLFGSTLDEEERLTDRARKTNKAADSTAPALASPDAGVQQMATRNQDRFDAAKTELEKFQAQRAWVADAIMVFRRYGYDGLADPDLIPDSESHKSVY